jgi:hypothetical protein
LTSDSEAWQLAGFQEIWVETTRIIYGDIRETEVIRFTRPNGTVIWATSLVVSVLAATGDVHHLTVYGVTEDGKRVKDEFQECADEYPNEIAPLVEALVNAVGEEPGEEAKESVPIYRTATDQPGNGQT